MKDYFDVIYIIAVLYSINDKVRCSDITTINYEWCSNTSLACYVSLSNNYQSTILANSEIRYQSEWFACCNF